MPAMAMFRFAKVATPLDAPADVVIAPPVNVAPVLSANVTVELLLVMTFPKGSSTVTVTAGLMATPTVLADG